MSIYYNIPKVILTCTYIAVRSKFRDKQDTNIKISTEKTKDGDITSTLNIRVVAK